MNFLFKPTLSKEITQFLSGVENLHPNMDEEIYAQLSDSLKKAVSDLPLFSSQYDYLMKIAPSFTIFKDTFTFVDFREESLYSATVFPVDFIFLNHSVVVRNSVGNIIPSGSTVEKINGKPIAEIMSDFEDLVFASTAEEKRFWVIERGYLTLYPEFFKASQYHISYQLDSIVKDVVINTIPWREYSSWKERLNSDLFAVYGNQKTTVLKINNLNYDNRKIHDLRSVLQTIVEENPENLVVDVSYCNGLDTNYYAVQLLLSFLTDQESYLIPESISNHSEQVNKIAVIPQEKSYTGNLFFLTSRYSIYPLVRTLLAFSAENKVGLLVGEVPISDFNYFSNPFSEPLYNSYLVPKINRQLNKFTQTPMEELYYKSRTFFLDESLILLKNDPASLSFISDTLL